MTNGYTTRTLTADDGTEILINVPTSLPTPARVEVLNRAFDRVKDPTHWKLPVRALVTIERYAELDDIVEAVAFYTATEATVTPLGGRNGKTFRVDAPGYYNGPAN